VSRSDLLNPDLWIGDDAVMKVYAAADDSGQDTSSKGNEQNVSHPVKQAEILS
jgi:hypothetical protein